MYLNKQKIVIASHNQGKVKEISTLLAPFGCTVLCASDFNLSEPEETENSFNGNALLKARYVSEQTGKIALADDSGLCVDLLDGAPGIYSARWAQKTPDDEKDFIFASNLIKQKIIEKHGQDILKMPLKAHFICALALVFPTQILTASQNQDIQNKYDVLSGKVEGHLTFPPTGEKGFGYDPIFIPDGYQITFAQMEPEFKHHISHRARAFNLLVKKYFSSS